MKQTNRMFYTINEFAEVSGIPRKTIYHWIYKGWLPTVQLGRRRLIPAEYVEQKIKQALQEHMRKQK